MELMLVASASTLAGVADTAPLEEAATALGVSTRVVDWRSEAATVGDAHAALLHSPWDYVQHLAEFRTWLERTSTLLPVFNSWEQISFNTHKGYLLDLAAEGVSIPRTSLLAKNTPVDRGQLRERFGRTQVVIKPAVGSGGRRLERLRGVDELWSSTLLSATGAPEEDLLLQAFVPSINDLGEYSAVLIGGVLAHVVQKRPAAGEFRVQSRFGGRLERVSADIGTHQMITALPARIRDLAYARVDYVLDEDGSPLLMELEVTEPDLYLTQAPETADALVQHMLQHLDERKIERSEYRQMD